MTFVTDGDTKLIAAIRSMVITSELQLSSLYTARLRRPTYISVQGRVLNKYTTILGLIPKYNTFLLPKYCRKIRIGPLFNYFILFNMVQGKRVLRAESHPTFILVA